MHKSKLIELLKSLSKAEIREFGRYIDSSFFNKNKTLIELYSYIKRYYPKFESDRLNKQLVFKKLYPEQKFNGRKMREALSDLSLLLEDYIVWVETKKAPLNHHHFLMQAFKSRSLDKYFFKAIHESQQLLEKSPERDMYHYNHQLRLSHHSYFYQNAKRLTTNVDSLENMMTYLDIFYVTAKLRYSCEMLVRERFVHDKYNIHFLDEVLQLIQKAPFVNNPLLNIYELIIDLFKNNNDSIYPKLKALTYKHINLGGFEEKKTLWIFLINYSILSVNAGKMNYMKEMFDLYKFGLQNKLLIENGYLEAAHFINIVDVGCVLKEIKWTEQFIEDYTAYLIDSTRFNTRTLCLAGLFFNKNDFQNTLTMLQDVSFEDVSYALRAKSFLLRSYYELERDGRFMPVNDFCNAYEKYLRRNKIISENVRLANLNLIRLVRKLLKAPYTPLYTSKVLQVELNKTKLIVSRMWLTQKIKELS